MTRAVIVLLILIAVVLLIVVVAVAILLTTDGSPAPPSPPATAGVAQQPAGSTASPAPATPPAASPTPAQTGEGVPTSPPATAQPTPPAASPAPAQTGEAVPTSPPPTAQPTPSPAAWVRPGHKYGIHLLLDDGRNHWLPERWPQHVEAARQFVGEGGYVVQLIRLDDLNVPRWQFFLDLCAREHLVPIIRLAPAYDHVKKWWTAPPKDAGGQGYTEIARQSRDFFAQLRWPTSQHYVIVGNEPNRGDEWSNQPNPAEYARFLLDVSQALHQIGITILAPALDLYAPHSNGQLIAGHRYIDAETFLDEMAAAYPRVFEAIDIWASHAYPLDPFRLDPSRQTFQIDYAYGAANPRHLQPPDGIVNRGVNSYRWELWKLEQIAGPGAATLPVMITETGWRHAPSQDPAARDNVHAELGVETLSAYVDLAFHGNQGRYPDLPATGWTPWNDDPQVLAVVLFALGGLPSVWGHTNWVLLDEGGQVTDRYPITLQR